MGTESVAQNTWEKYGYVTSMPWVVGDFIWTAIDYYGDMYFPTTTGDVDYLNASFASRWTLHALAAPHECRGFFLSFSC